MTLYVNDEADSVLFDQMGTGMRSQREFPHSSQLQALALNMAVLCVDTGNAAGWSDPSVWDNPGSFSFRGDGEGQVVEGSGGGVDDQQNYLAAPRHVHNG